MDQFELARLKGLKRAEKHAQRKLAQAEIQTPEQKEPQVPKLLQPKPKTVMRVVFEDVQNGTRLAFDLDYGGALTAGQLAPESLKASIKKQLSVFGRVNDVS